MNERRTDDATLIAAVRILARTITTEDGVIPACLAEAANRLETLVEERRWIPVGERMPELDVEVLQTDGANIRMGWLTKTGWDSDQFYLKPTHWQPLPKPPEGE